MKRHNFFTDLPRGQACERVFRRMHRGLLTRIDGKRGDFILVRTGEKVELKSEVSYSATDPSANAARKFREAMSIAPPSEGWRKTGNLFVERYSSKDARTPGGPWQARAHGA